MTQVFLSYAREDQATARRLAKDLASQGVQVWLDTERLPGGGRWREHIRRAMTTSRYFVLLVSRASTGKRGFVQVEVREALQLLAEFPPTKRFLIPVRLEDCEVNWSELRELQWIDLFPSYEDGVARLVDAVHTDDDGTPSGRTTPSHSLSGTPIRIATPIVLELVPVPAGSFGMGEWPKNVEPAPAPTVVSEFYISRYPITVSQFNVYAQQTHEVGLLRRLRLSARAATLPDHPITNVSWLEALRFCKWLRLASMQPIRLPTEAEWEKAARGTDGRAYPWGDEWEPRCCNGEQRNSLWDHLTGEAGSTTAVGRFSPWGDSPYGISDMSGNVWEWCLDGYHSGARLQGRTDPLDWEPYREVHLVPRGQASSYDSFYYRAVRGGSWSSRRDQLCCWSRRRADENEGEPDLGFRVVISDVYSERVLQV